MTSEMAFCNSLVQNEASRVEQLIRVLRLIRERESKRIYSPGQNSNRTRINRHVKYPSSHEVTTKLLPSYVTDILCHHFSQVLFEESRISTPQLCEVMYLIVVLQLYPIALQIVSSWAAAMCKQCSTPPTSFNIAADPLSLSTAVWALAKSRAGHSLKNSHPEIYQRWIDWWMQSFERLESLLQPQSLSLSIWSLATLQQHPTQDFYEAWMNAFTQRLSENKNKFSLQALSNIIWGHAQLSIPVSSDFIKEWTDAFLYKLELEIQSQKTTGRRSRNLRQDDESVLSMQSVANSLWALVKLDRKEISLDLKHAFIDISRVLLMSPVRYKVKLQHLSM
eukprot:CAMPEP_0182444758 /NCGR_PEP_ID=MMETSP1172-20130603/3115_1 /TAXON_ID=708627 /ORGANISM="Timspurckia oligopyrenoides, Strain CCMP3278" /LENGTH=335 /DNA_ID=CAMNT_0024640393 /DNA_START=1 /DNA_END=1005 /DNA_ORIENTATION=+